MRRAFVILAAGFTVVACSSFGTGVSQRADGGEPPPVFDAGPTADMSTADAATPRAGPPLLPCLHALTSFREDFASGDLATWTAVKSGVDVVKVQPYGDGETLATPPFVHMAFNTSTGATGSDLADMNHALPSVTAPSWIQLDFDMSAMALGNYSEAGCQVYVEGSEQNQSMLMYFASKDGDGLAGGYDYANDSGTGSGNTTSKFPGYTLSHWHHLTLRIESSADGVTNRWFVDGDEAGTISADPFAFSVYRVSLQCGVLYVHASETITVDVALDNIAFDACPQ